MAKSTLPTNFKDDILNSSMGGKRRYKLINNSDGTVSLEDASAYDQVGSEYGASQVNAANAAVNASADAGKIVDDINNIGAITQKGYIAGALALKQVNDSLTALGGFEPVIDESTGKITGYKTTIGGADTVFPFSSELSFEKLYDVSYGMNQTASFDFRDQDDYSGFLIVSLKVDSVSQIVNNGFSGSDIKTIIENGIWWKDTTVSIMHVGYTTRKQTVSIYGSGSGAVLGYFAVYGIKH